MRWPRLTTRRWMVAIALVALLLVFERVLFAIASDMVSSHGEPPILTEAVVAWGGLHVVLAILFGIPIVAALEAVLSSGTKFPAEIDRNNPPEPK